jgi:hypothetical protein
MDDTNNILEPNDTFGEGEKVYSHQQLVMMAQKKIIESRCKELREGWWDSKFDKFGNEAKTYHTDTRKEFLGAVKALMIILECDYDTDAKTNINKLKEQLKTRKDFWMNEEFTWWNTLNPQQKQLMVQQGKQVNKGMFNSKLNFDNFFYDEETDIYVEIATELNNLIKRMDFFGEVEYEA